VLRELNDPAARLFQAVQRYTDSLHIAAQQLLESQTVAELDQADQYIPGLTAEPAWPALRAHLLTLAAETGNTRSAFAAAATGGDLRTADDMAAVLDWRLTALAPSNSGPLPWLAGISEALHAHPLWGPYLAKRSQLVADFADQIQGNACRGDGEPVWVPPGTHPGNALIGEIAVWRAANGINLQRLDRQIARSADPAGSARFNEQQAAHTAPNRWRDGSQRPYHRPGQPPNGPAAPGR